MLPLVSFSRFGPTDITRRVGEDDVVIICPTRKYIAPVWSINNYTYGASSLPLPFLPAYDNLLIPYVELNMDKFTFQCFIPTGVGLDVVGSSIGTLTVDYGNTFLPVIDNRLVVDHWRLHFNAENFTLSWKYLHEDNQICSFDDVTSVSYTHLTLPTNREV